MTYTTLEPTALLSGNIRLSVSIMAHESRATLLKSLIGELERPGLRVGVVIHHGEPTKTGVWEVAKRAWALHPNQATHHMVLCDDTLPCFNLIETVLHLLTLIPIDSISLYNRRKYVEQALAAGGHWVKGRVGINGQGSVHPVSVVRHFLDWCEKTIQPGFLYDDARWNYYLLHHRRPAWITAPSLLDHVQVKSVSGNTFPNRVAKRFIGEEDPLAIDWTRGLNQPVLDHDLGGYSFERDLKKWIIPYAK